jgi:outer membrane biosynthesis protein TonB
MRAYEEGDRDVKKIFTRREPGGARAVELDEEMTAMTMRKSFTAVLTTVLTLAGATAYAGEGTLDKEEIRKVVRAHIDEVRYCYNKVLETQPDAKAKLVVDFTIGGDGAVTKSSIGSLEGSAELGSCVNAAVKTWKFPAPTGGEVAVSYPFVMEPG